MLLNARSYTAVSVLVLRGRILGKLTANGMMPVHGTGKINFKAKWRFLTQAFAGAGVYLNDNWSLTVGYRLRYLPGDANGSRNFRGEIKWDWKVKQNLSHAAEMGLTYRF